MISRLKYKIAVDLFKKHNRDSAKLSYKTIGLKSINELKSQNEFQVKATLSKVVRYGIVFPFHILNPLL